MLLKWQRRHAQKVNVLLKLLTTMLGEFNLFEFTSKQNQNIFFSSALLSQIPKRPKTSQNILTASRNKMQLGKTKFQLELLLKNACTCV